MKILDIASFVSDLRVGSSELPTLELKRQWWNLKDPKGQREFLKDICGMCNAHSAEPIRTILVGVSERGKVSDAPLPVDEAQLQQRLSAIEPHPDVQFEVIDVEGCRVSKIEISGPFTPPYVARWNSDHYIWVRKGTATFTASRKDLDRMYVRRGVPTSIPVLKAHMEHDTEPNPLVEFLYGNDGGIVFLECHVGGLEPSKHGECDLFVLEPSGTGSGGYEVLVENPTNTSDYSFHWFRGGHRLRGYFAVRGFLGPYQGYMSISLKALSYEDAIRAT